MKCVARHIRYVEATRHCDTMTQAVLEIPPYNQLVLRLINPIEDGLYPAMDAILSEIPLVDIYAPRSKI